MGTDVGNQSQPSFGDGSLQTSSDQVTQPDLTATQDKGSDLKLPDPTTAEFTLPEVRDDGQRGGYLNPTFLALVAAALGLIGNIFVAYLNGSSSAAVERERLQSDLVLAALKTSDQTAACYNLLFLVKLKLLDDTNHALETTCSTKRGTPVSGSPVLPVPGGPATFCYLRSYYDWIRAKQSGPEPSPGPRWYYFSSNQESQCPHDYVFSQQIY